MSERRLVVDHMRLKYEGLFSAFELYKLIDNWLREKAFDRRELRNEEHVRPDGKYVELVLMPWKKITDYARHVIRLEIRMHKLKEVVVEKDGQRMKMNQGRVDMIIDAYLDTDYEDRWEQKPFYFFMRTLFDKFIYRTYSTQFEELLVENVHQLHTAIKSFLNLYKYEFEPMTLPEMTKL
ncbi:hypothetical protein HYX10_03565 [Candidatus Woesearchaeota archaeon]|nr:hypothetical protein [Candidatus Woesearchaeota archaeon]